LARSCAGFTSCLTEMRLDPTEIEQSRCFYYSTVLIKSNARCELDVSARTGIAIALSLELRAEFRGLKPTSRTNLDRKEEDTSNVKRPGRQLNKRRHVMSTTATNAPETLA